VIVKRSASGYETMRSLIKAIAPEAASGSMVEPGAPTQKAGVQT
jgi:hypothetical protein